MYKVSFDFPYGKTWLKSFFVDDRVSHSIQIPEFTENEAEAKIYDDEQQAINDGRFYAGKYNYEVVKIWVMPIYTHSTARKLSCGVVIHK